MIAALASSSEATVSGEIAASILARASKYGSSSPSSDSSALILTPGSLDKLRGRSGVLGPRSEEVVEAFEEAELAALGGESERRTSAAENREERRAAGVGVGRW